MIGLLLALYIRFSYIEPEGRGRLDHCTLYVEQVGEWVEDRWYLPASSTDGGRVFEGEVELVPTPGYPVEEWFVSLGCADVDGGESPRTEEIWIYG